MGSKRFRGQACVYCGRTSGTKDHVFARSFFAADDRQDLIHVPACTSCNNNKSRLEGTLGGLLMFGARHSKWLPVVRELAPGRLLNDRKLRKALEEGFQKVADHGEYEINYNYAELEEWLQLIVRGLIWHHWKQIVPNDFELLIEPLPEKQATQIDTLFDEFQNIAVVGVREEIAYAGLIASDDPPASLFIVRVFWATFASNDSSGMRSFDRFAVVVRRKTHTPTPDPKCV